MACRKNSVLLLTVVAAGWIGLSLTDFYPWKSLRIHTDQTTERGSGGLVEFAKFENTDVGKRREKTDVGKGRGSDLGTDHGQTGRVTIDVGTGRVTADFGTGRVTTDGYSRIETTGLTGRSIDCGQPDDVTGRRASPNDDLLRRVHFQHHGPATRLFSATGDPLQPKDHRNLAQCLGRWSHIAFVGDSRVRQLFQNFYAIGSGTNLSTELYHEDRESRVGDVILEFRWQPESGRTLEALLRTWTSLSPSARPALIILGMGIWEIRSTHASEAGVKAHQDNLRRLTHHLADLTNHSVVVWLPQDPTIESRLAHAERMITPRMVHRYNSVAQGILEDAGIPIWQTSLRTALHFKNFYTKDGIHPQPIVYQYKVQILLNWMCCPHVT